jgi:hypothetical protein
MEAKLLKILTEVSNGTKSVEKAHEKIMNLFGEYTASASEYPENTSFILVKEYDGGPKLDTIVRKMGDGGYEEESGDFTYYWWTDIELNDNWKLYDIDD